MDDVPSISPTLAERVVPRRRRRPLTVCRPKESTWTAAYDSSFVKVSVAKGKSKFLGEKKRHQDGRTLGHETASRLAASTRNSQDLEAVPSLLDIPLASGSTCLAGVSICKTNSTR